MPTVAPLRVRIICHDLGRGGAARATTRLIGALHPRQDELGLELSVRTASGPPHPLEPHHPLPGGVAEPMRRAAHFIRHKLDQLPSSCANEGLRSRADVWTGIGRETSRAPLDVVNIHWIGTGTMSIGEIGRLRHPVVMTLHDMWAFSGAEHVNDGVRYRTGYSRASRPSTDTGIDWDRLTWRRKRRHWQTPTNVIAPSTWLAECVKSSALMSEWPTTVIPNPIDADYWSPIDRNSARARESLPEHATLILFGSDGVGAQQLKGLDLLEAAIRRIPFHLSPSYQGHKEILLVTIGGDRPRFESAGRLPIPVKHLGRIESDNRLRAIYSACDVVVVPSRIDNLPNIAAEAQACGVPVVAFNVGGLADIVKDAVTGRLVPPYDIDEMAVAITWVTQSPALNSELGQQGRVRVKQVLDPSAIANAYRTVFESARRQSTGDYVNRAARRWA